MAGRLHLRDRMSLRIRHCVECPQCHTCYLIAFNPYSNGAYLMHAGASSSEEYTLYCFCQGGPFPRVWKWRQAKACEVSKAAHDRGYGTVDEIWPAEREPQTKPCFGFTRSVNFRQS